MAAIGDVALSLVTAEQKAQLALANFNFDFTLVKIPAPDEYKGVGNAISSKRKKDAEDGSSHVVARKLAALFTQDVDFPKVPHLIGVYGTRASQISHNAKCNPRGSRHHGVFADHIGLDGTSIWAAATSGSGAIAVHLLACLLATVWSRNHATAIWQEIVLSRKVILQKRVQSSEFQLSDVTAAQIEISREQLAMWDTSARAWCQTANEAFALQQNQLRLIVQGFSKALPSSPDIYSVVKRVWYKAMVVLDKLIQGIPQSVQDPEVLIGLLSWHIYPDMSVIGDKPKTVLQNDPLVQKGGIVTLGMITNREASSTGISWSLPLSHLRYYGEPVVRKATIEESASRIHFEEFMFVVLGGLTKTWFETLADVEPSFRFLVALRDFLKRSIGPATCAWVSAIGNAAEAFLQREGDSRAEAQQLVSYGRRKCGFFSSGVKLPIAFGLRRRPTQFGLLRASSPTDTEGKIRWLRSQLPRALPSNYPVESCVIAYRHLEMDNRSDAPATSKSLKAPNMHSHAPHPDTKELVTEIEFASLVTLQSASSGSTRTYRRWVSANETALLNAASVPGFHDVRTTSARRCLALRSTSESSGLYLNHSKTWAYGEFFDGRDDFRVANGQPFSLPFIPTAKLVSPIRTLSLEWTHFVRQLNPSFNAAKAVLGMADQRSKSKIGTSPLDVSVSANQLQTAIDSDSSHARGEYGLADRGKNKPPCLSRSSVGENDFQFSTNVNQYGCPRKWYAPEQVPTTTPAPEHYLWLTGPVEMSVFFPTPTRPKFFVSKIEHVTELLDSDAFDPVLLWRSLDTFFEDNDIEEQLRSLRAVAIASEIYAGLPDAKVPISVATKSNFDYKWAWEGYPRLSRAFACIASFEAGESELDIDPADLSKVMAVSVSDSLYMAQRLSCDPTDPIRGWGVQRAIGNVGRPGLAFLVAPTNPKISKPDDGSWKIVKHDEYDGQSEDNFGSTSLHLSFTGSELPISMGDLGLYDREAYFLEAVVGAFDGGKWVADLDILSWIPKCSLAKVLHPQCPYSRGGATRESKQDHNKPPSSLGRLTSIDSWAELLDPPHGKCVVRAKGNWLARLALATVLAQKQTKVLIFDDKSTGGSLCWGCVRVVGKNKSDIMILD